MDGKKVAAGGSAGSVIALAVAYVAQRLNWPLDKVDVAAIVVGAAHFGAFFLHAGGFLGIWNLLLHGEASASLSEASETIWRGPLPAVPQPAPPPPATETPLPATPPV